MPLVPASLIRGGTSKGLFFRAESLARFRDGDVDEVIKRAMGVPDPTGMQLNGVGGGISSTSKVAIVQRSSTPGFDIDYRFGQVDTKSGDIDWSGTCGNLASAVFLFAVDQGLMPKETLEMRVRCDVSYPAEFTLRRAVGPGSLRQIAGVPSEAMGVDVCSPAPPLLRPGEPVTKLINGLSVTILAGLNTTIFVQSMNAARIGSVDDFKAAVAAEVGLADNAALRVSFVEPPRDYVASNGVSIAAKEYDVFARITTPGRPWHHAYTASGLFNLASACAIKDSIPWRACGLSELSANSKTTLRIGHPGGLTPMIVSVGPESGKAQYIVVERSARLLFKGEVNAE